MIPAFRRLLVLLVVLTCAAAEVTVENKAFQNVKVSFSQTVPPDDGQSLLLEMQNTITEASQVLKNAVGLKVGSVSFILPSSWDTSAWESITIQAASAQTLDSPADITVDGITDGAFGQYPFTVQYAGCGIPGEKIRIPKDFLTKESEFSKGKLLAREWLKFRYGVFDENGFPGDDMYPLYERLYGRHGEYQVTSCADSEVEYFFRKQDGSNCTIDDDTGLPKEGDCRIYPLEDSTQNVTSSLMYFHEHLPNIEHICGDEAHKHDDSSSNKQNLLCRGRSIWDVLKSSPDFASQNNEEEPTTEDEIKFSYVQEKNPKVVIAWDSTSRTKPKKETIFSVIERFLYDLPDGSEYALYSYQDDTSTQVQPLTKLANWPEGRDKSFFSDFTKPDAACTACAIEEAVKVLSPVEAENPELTGTIVIIASSDPEEKEDVIKALQESQICLLVIAFVDSGASVAGFQKYIDASSCGSVWEVPNSDEKADIFANMYEAMDSILPRKINNEVTSTVLTGYLRYEKEMEIPIDTTTGTVFLWIRGFSHESNIRCHQEDIELDLDMPVKTRDLTAVRFTPNLAVTAKCSFKQNESDTIMTQVRSTSKPGAYYEMNSWVVDTTDKDSEQQMPIIIYVSVNYGSYPVRNAEVKAVVKTPDGEEAASLLLADNGRGDPDVTANDGIYSRYFTRFNAEGEYTVSITAKDNEQAAWGKNGQERCCGSIVNSENSRLGAFELASELSFKAVSGRPEDGYKPSRISDLRIEKFEAQSIELKWTAPGGEADNGAARNYIAKSFTSLDEATKYFDNSTESRTFNLTFVPTEYGNIETASIELDGDFKDNTKYFIAVKGANEHGKVGDVSNIIEVYISENLRTTEEPRETSTVDDTKVTKQADKNKKTVGIIIGVIVAVIVLAIIAYAAVHYFVIKPKQKAEKESRASNNLRMERNPAENNIMNPLNSIPADVLIKHHNEVLNAKSQHKSPPVFKEEDIEAQKSSANNSDNNNANYSQTGSKEDTSSQPVPPKSPKRMTFV